MITAGNIPEKLCVVHEHKSCQTPAFLEYCLLSSGDGTPKLKVGHPALGGTLQVMLWGDAMFEGSLWQVVLAEGKPVLPECPASFSVIVEVRPMFIESE